MYDIFAMEPFRFPDNFVWGSGYSGHQVEGNNYNSQWWAKEQEWEEGGNPEPSGLACNSFLMYETDASLAYQLGHKAFRTSVEWSRIEPSEGHFERSAVDHYLRVFSGLRERGIRPFVTLVHNTYPLWFEKKGGFHNMDNLKYFERYLEFIVPKLAPYADYWNVLNEFNFSLDPAMGQHKINCLRFHGYGYNIIKQHSAAPVSSAHALVHFAPYRPRNEADEALVKFYDVCNHEFFFHAIRTGEIIMPFCKGVYDPFVRGAADFWSINYYTRELIDARKPGTFSRRYNHLKLTDAKHFFNEFFPEVSIAEFQRLRDKPVFITENGCSVSDDRFRIVYLATYLSALKECIDMGVDIKGYLHWSLLDNYEWGSYRPTFGLCRVDRRQQFLRKPRPSAYFYRDIIRNNGFTQDVLRKYLTEMPSRTNEKLQ